jgi:uncharacterized protein
MADWSRIGSRGNVQDRRSLGPAVGGISLAGLALTVAFTLLSGGDLNDVLNNLQNVSVPQQSIDTQAFAGADAYETFAATVLGSTNDTWSAVFSGNNLSYEPPQLVLFRGATESSCGGAYSQTGPHYCPIDETIYLDETFFDELTDRLGAQGGDVAQAYVIAHEVGHHVQHQLGVAEQVLQGSNDASVRLELQADCYAGLWANSIRDAGVFGEGEIGEAIDAAAAVGDDRVQQSTSGRVNPETWTHGSSADRMRWFSAGYESGSVERCNTFAAQ